MSRGNIRPRFPSQLGSSNSLKRLAGRRGLKLNETTHLRHALDMYLAQADPIFRAWLDGAPGK
jgi:hypothetical protein